jgi:hypothetical protein
MSSITLNSPELSGGTVTFEISAEAVQLVDLATNPKGYQSVFRFKLLAAATITQLKLIPATDPAGNVNDAVLDVLASLKDVVALAEAASDF